MNAPLTVTERAARAPSRLVRSALAALALSALAGCGIAAPTLPNPFAGSCRGAQTFSGQTVNVCSENPGATVDQQATLNVACTSGALGDAAREWRANEGCGSAGRIGGCSGTVMGIAVTTWIYPPAGSPFNAEVAARSCPSGWTFVGP